MGFNGGAGGGGVHFQRNYFTFFPPLRYSFISILLVLWGFTPPKPNRLLHRTYIQFIGITKRHKDTFLITITICLCLKTEFMANKYIKYLILFHWLLLGYLSSTKSHNFCDFLNHYGAAPPGCFAAQLPLVTLWLH